MSGPLTFQATLLLGGKNATGLEVPPEVIERLGAGKKPAVHVRLGECAYRSTVAVRGGKFMLPVSAEHRAGAGIQAGDVLDVTLELDTEPREVSVPDDLQAALDANAAAKQRFEALSYSRQRQHTLAVEGAKTPETRQRRIDGAIAALTKNEVTKLGRDATEASAFMGGLVHARKPEIEALRRIILGADARIHEGVKWNSLSFFTVQHGTVQHFATFRLGPAQPIQTQKIQTQTTHTQTIQTHTTQTQPIQLVFHTGAKVRAIPLPMKVDVADPSGLMRWVAEDRGVMTFLTPADIQDKQAALEALVRQWIGPL
ncbi:YdeI/OmpD-associated family protein [Deinococcus marmoris]|uniref:YdeI/OmpD-associated family protein n=1 Tax=Deinococcus marmoris TaxID=249408 RepID=UPI0009DE6508|nr:YdeI/OmpD-associated family protein [Deinococcus marmoris]